LISTLWTTYSVEDLVVRGFNHCIIDEVDPILIDEARTPLIISGPAEKPTDHSYKAAKIAEAFERDIHYTVSLLYYVHILKFNVLCLSGVSLLTPSLITVSKCGTLCL